MLLDILSFVGGTAFVLAIVTFLARQLVLHRLSKDLDSYRSVLETERHRQVETLRHQFEKTALEHQVTFERVYAQRHDALKGLHLKLRECLDLCLGTAMSNGDAKVRPALDALQALRQELYSCEIYLPREVR